MSLRDLESFLHDKIPLSRAMGVTVIEVGKLVVLEAPLAPNINHLDTAFGGSLHTLPTLACYTALWTLLREAGIDSHVIVKSSSANYREPVRGTLSAVCVRPTGILVENFLHTFARYNRAQLELTATVAGANGKPAVEFTGCFVALK